MTHSSVSIAAAAQPVRSLPVVQSLGLGAQVEYRPDGSRLECGRVLVRQFVQLGGAIEEATANTPTAARLARRATVVEPIDAVQVVASDPADDRVREAARAAGADVVVGRDRHLDRAGGTERDPDHRARGTPRSRW